MMEQKTWLITGAAEGIGQCLAYYLIGLKQKVIVLDIQKEKLDQMKDVLRNSLFHPYVCDLSQESDMNAFVKSLKAEELHIDVIIHNAVHHQKGMLETTYDDMVLGMKVNVVAPMFLTKSLIPLLNKDASIIHILSTRAYQSEPNNENYAAAKGALSSLTHAMMMTLKGVARVNAIAPGWIDTSSCEIKSGSFENSDHEQHPSKRIGAPMDIINTLLFLADSKQNFINGETIVVDGGMSKSMIYHHEQGWTYDPK